ncbi:MAG: GNAT family N-acetyltransferase [Candidatus Thermoplasmatota archaeon]|nr:GNAT family N-acetyltransferase [Candidatus Thermoplasmatota archaeon]
MKTVALNTTRLVLLPLKKEHLMALHRGVREPIYGYIPHWEWPGPELLEALPVMINDLMDDPSSFGWHAWAIIERESGMIIGDVGLKGPPDPQGVVRSGYSIVGPLRRKVYAREALETFSEHVTNEKGISRMMAEVHPDNIPSKNLLASLGWGHESIRDGLEVWTIGKDDIGSKHLKRRKAGAKGTNSERPGVPPASTEQTLEGWSSRGT